MKLLPEVADGTRILKVQFPSFGNLRGSHTALLNALRVFLEKMNSLEFLNEICTRGRCWDQDIESEAPRL